MDLSRNWSTQGDGDRLSRDESFDQRLSNRVKFLRVTPSRSVSRVNQTSCFFSSPSPLCTTATAAITAVSRKFRAIFHFRSLLPSPYHINVSTLSIRTRICFNFIDTGQRGQYRVNRTADIAQSCPRCGRFHPRFVDARVPVLSLLPCGFLPLWLKASQVRGSIFLTRAPPMQPFLILPCQTRRSGSRNFDLQLYEFQLLNVLSAFASPVSVGL